MNVVKKLNAITSEANNQAAKGHYAIACGLYTAIAAGMVALTVADIVYRGVLLTVGIVREVGHMASAHYKHGKREAHK